MLFFAHLASPVDLDLPKCHRDLQALSVLISIPTFTSNADTSFSLKIANFQS